MAEKTNGGGVTVARRPSFRKTLREHEDSLPAEYLDALEQKRKQLDDSIHKYIAVKEREYKQYEKELKQQTKSGTTGPAATAAVQTSASGSANGNGLLAPTKRRTSSESTQSTTSCFLAPQQHGAVDALLGSGLRRHPVSPVVEEDGGGADRPGTANLKNPRASAEREKDFVGLFTPPYLPLIDHKDERTLKRTESAPSDVEPSSRTTVPVEATSLPKADSESAMYAKYKRPVHLQLAKRTSSSGSSADGKLASAMKSPQQSMLRPKRKRVSLAVGDSIVAPSDNVPVATKNSTTASHSRTRSPETEREKVAVIQAGPTAAMDFAQQPPSTDTTTASPAPSNSEPPPSGRTLAAAATSASSPRKSIDPDGDLFDLEDESDNTPHPMGDFESAIESEEDAAPGIAGRIERSTEPEERNEVPVPSPRLEIGESYSYDPEAGLIPQPTAEDTHPTSKTNAAKPDKATHLECRPRTASAASAGFSSSSSQQPTSPGFKRPAVDSDPISRGPDHYCFEGETAAPGVEEETYGSSFSRPPTKGSFTGGSLGESFMAKHAEEMMRSRGGKKELAVR